MLKVDFAYEDVECNLCASNSHSELFVGDRHGLNLRTVMCKNCSLVFTNPRPEERSLEDFYQNHYRTMYESTLTPDQEYIDHGEFKFRSEIVLSHIRGLIEQKTKEDKPMDILDVGCSEGSTLKLLGSNYSKTTNLYGVEPSINFAKFATKHAVADVYCGTLEQYICAGHSGVKFDLIILNHVLEHFSSPLDQLKRIHQILSPGGNLFVEVPNILGDWQGKSMIHIAHLFNFSESTLCNILRKAGFEPLKISKKGNHLHPWALAVVATKSEPGVIELPQTAQIDADFKMVRNKFYMGQLPGSDTISIVQKMLKRLRWK